MANNIEIYQKNTKRLTLTVGGLTCTGYTPYLSVKKNITDSSTVIFRAGTISDASTVIIDVTSTDTSLAKGFYVYDITLEKDSSIYTVVKDSFTILDGIKY